jgi:hypothetical protein
MIENLLSIIRQEILETRAPTRQVATIRNHRYMILNTSARRKGIQVILDSSTQGNFILLEIIRSLNILIQEKEEFYLFIVINRIAIK